MKTLVLGGVRSGKSRFAENLAARGGQPVTYIATATAEDDEMRRRIEAHRHQRNAAWRLVEEPKALAATLTAHVRPGQCVLVDCLTLWLTNLLTATDRDALERERDNLFKLLPDLEGDIIFVSNETGLGIAPLGELTRRFGDEAGRMHQTLAQLCDHVHFMVAGLPMTIKGQL